MRCIYIYFPKQSCVCLIGYQLDSYTSFTIRLSLRISKVRVHLNSQFFARCGRWQLTVRSRRLSRFTIERRRRLRAELVGRVLNITGAVARMHARTRPGMHAGMRVPAARTWTLRSLSLLLSREHREHHAWPGSGSCTCSCMRKRKWGKKTDHPHRCPNVGPTRIRADDPDKPPPPICL